MYIIRFFNSIFTIIINWNVAHRTWSVQSYKSNDVIKFVSPVSGILKSIERGAKRKITSIIIESDGKMTQASNSVTDLAKQSREDVISSLLNGGLWPLIRMRPIDIIAQPTDKPKSIFILIDKIFSFLSSPSKLLRDFSSIDKGETATGNGFKLPLVISTSINAKAFIGNMISSENKIFLIIIIILSF